MNKLLFLLIALQYLNANPVKIKGNKVVSNANIQNIIKHIDKNDHQAIRMELSDSGLFDSVSVYKQKQDLIIALKEAKVIKSISWKGNNILNNEVCEKLANIKTGQLCTKAKIDQAISKIISTYAAKNMLVDCSCQIEPTEDKQGISLKFTILETSKAAINYIQLTGLKQAYQHQLLKEVRPIKRGFFSSSYEIALLDLYKYQITQQAQAHGFYDFYISGFNIERLSNNAFKLTFTAYEGEQYYLKNVTLKTKLHTSNKIKKIISHIKHNRVLNVTEINRHILDITQAYESEGHFVQVIPEYIKKPNQQIELIINVQTTRPTVLKDIKVSNNRTSSSRLIKRLTKLTPGQAITSKTLEKAKQNMHETGFFKQIDFNKEPLGDHLIDLDIHVEEANTINLGAKVDLGYGINPHKTKNRNEGNILWGVTFSYNTPNFLGEGYTIDSQVSVQNWHTQASLSFGQTAAVNSSSIGWKVIGGLNFGNESHSFEHEKTEKFGSYLISNSDWKESMKVSDSKSEDNAPANDITNQIDESGTDQNTSDKQTEEKTSTDSEKDDKTDPRKIELHWHRISANASLPIYTPINEHLLIGLTPRLSFSSHNLKKDKAKFPRIFSEPYFKETSITPEISIPISLSFDKYAPVNRSQGLSILFNPSISSNFTSITAHGIYNISLDRNYLSNLSLKASAGIMRPIHSKKIYWDELFKTPNMVTGINSMGARELTSMLPLGAQEYAAAQAKLILPVPFAPERVKFYCFAALGTMGNCGIQSQLIDPQTQKRLGFKDNLQDIVNDKHQLRVTAGVGISFMISESMILSIGYNHPIKYNKEFDHTNYVYFNISTNFEDA